MPPQCYARGVNFRRLPIQIAVGIGLLFAASDAFSFQREFRDYGGERPTELSPHALDPAEFVFGRFMYPSGGFGGFRGRDWRNYAPTQGWGNDYPAADRHLIVALRRL